MCLSCERRGRKSKLRLCSETFRIVCQKCGDDPDCIPPIDMVGRVVTVQGKQLYLAPCCAAIHEYAGTGRDFEGRNPWDPEPRAPCQHQAQSAACRPPGAGYRKARHACSVWNCQANALPRPHHVLDHLQGTMDSHYLCHRHTPPEEWLRRAKNFRQFSETCRAWDAKAKASHKK